MVTAPEPPRIWFAQALRGVACSLVVFAHLFVLFPADQVTAAGLGQLPRTTVAPPPWLEPALWAEARGFKFGTIGVAIFFLVSGFVIPFSLRDGSARAFATRRVFRLYPTLATCLVVVFLVISVQTSLRGLEPPFGLGHLFFNVTLTAPYFGQRWIDPVLWTLAIEELFYVTAGLLALRGLLASKRAVVAVGVANTALAAFLPTVSDTSAAYWLSLNLSMVTFILIGVAMHNLHIGRWRARETVLVAAALVVAYAVGLSHGPIPDAATEYIRSGLVGLLVFVTAAVFSARLPYNRPLDHLSNISYPMYLLHEVVGFTVLYALVSSTDNLYVGLIAAVLVIITGSALVHRFVEAPTMRKGRQLSKQVRSPVGS